MLGAVQLGRTMDGLRSRVAIGLSGAAVISAAARRARALSPGGTLAATLVGGVLVTGAGTRGAAALVAFFLSSTVLGRLPGAAVIGQRRGNERDAVQVLANGGVAALLSLASSSVGREQVRSLLLTGIGGAIAAAAADTWATEIGSRSGQLPRSIATLRIVAPGVSGGVTPAGLAAAAAGATVIASVATCNLREFPRRVLVRAFPIAVGGFTGSLVDSVLGATVQEVRFCDHCGLESEQHTHHCGARTRHIRGMPWCNNDTVNAIASAVGAATATLGDVACGHRGVVRATWRRPRV